MRRGRDRLSQVLRERVKQRPFSGRQLQAEGEALDRALWIKAADALADGPRFERWALGFKRRVLFALQARGAPIGDGSFRREFLTQARERLAAAGLAVPTGGSVRVNGERFRVENGFITFRDSEPQAGARFLALVRAGYVPIESLPENAPQAMIEHGARSHLVQALYLADAVGSGYGRLHRQLAQTRRGTRSALWFDFMESGRNLHLGNPAIVQRAACEFFRDEPCPDR
jgi:hypothetical protein